MVKTILAQVKEFRLISILTPVCMIGEVICEMIIPILMGQIVDRGVMAGNVSFIMRTGTLMIVVALRGLAAGVMGGFFAARAGAGLARNLGLKKLRKAFSYHGNVIGVTGVNPQGVKVGACSGGAGEFAEEAKNLGCGLYITGEASWGDVIAAENCGMEMVCAGHYATETFGVKALARAVRAKLKVATEFLPRPQSGRDAPMVRLEV